VGFIPSSEPRAEVHCFRLNFNISKIIDHFTVVCSVTWPLNGSEAAVDLVLIQTALLLSCKCA